MNVAFLLHLYQPSTQTENVFKQIYSNCYHPLLKIIKNKSEASFTLNMPLSLLEQMDKYGYSEWIGDIKELAENERIEITGTAAYHPLLTRIPEKNIYEQIILNEYALGYYIGSKQGFEGEASILIKNIKGFFPPEMAVNEEVVKIVNDLGYEWIIADKCAIPDLEATTFNENVYKYKDLNTYIVVRDCDISNLLSFKRDGEIADVMEMIHKKQQIKDNLVIALDGETFGHHNSEGLYALDSLIDGLISENINVVSVSEVVAECTKDKAEILIESNWSEVVCSTEPAKLYKLWDNKKNQVQQALWDLQKKILSKYSLYPQIINIPGLENVPLWTKISLPQISEEDSNRIELDNLVNKSLHSDQFWWASGESLYDKVLFSPEMIKAALDIYKEISVRMNDPEIIKFTAQKADFIEKKLTEKTESQK